METLTALTLMAAAASWMAVFFLLRDDRRALERARLALDVTRDNLALATSHVNELRSQVSDLQAKTNALTMSAGIRRNAS